MTVLPSEAMEKATGNCQSSLLYVVLQDDGAKQQRDSYKTFMQSKKLKCTGVVRYAVESGNRGIVQQAKDVEPKESTTRTWKARYAEELQRGSHGAQFPKKGRSFILCRSKCPYT